MKTFISQLYLPTFKQNKQNVEPKNTLISVLRPNKVLNFSEQICERTFCSDIINIICISCGALKYYSKIMASIYFSILYQFNKNVHKLVVLGYLQNLIVCNLSINKRFPATLAFLVSQFICVPILLFIFLQKGELVIRLN